MGRTQTLRNVAIVVALAAAVRWLPGGGRGAPHATRARGARGAPPMLVAMAAATTKQKLSDAERARADTAEQRRALPDQPGVYLFRDGRGRVLYVGKAKSVRKRVASHFTKAQVPSSPGHAELVAGVERIECVVVASEAEALLAEQSFIKQYRPRF